MPPDGTRPRAEPLAQHLVLSATTLLAPWAVSVRRALAGVRYGYDWGFPSSSPIYYLNNLASAGTNAPTGAVASDTGKFHTGYSNSSGTLFWGHDTGGPVAGDPLTSASASSQTPALAVGPNGNYLFYTNTAGTPQISYYKYTDSTNTYTGPTSLTSASTSRSFPSAIWVGSTLWLFSYNGAGYLMQNHWTSAGGWVGESQLDGGGQSTTNWVGQYVQAIIDTSMTTPSLRVFYYDSSVNSLRTAVLGSGGTWTYTLIDSGGGGEWIAPVINTNPVSGAVFMQVYYIDPSIHVLRGASFQGGAWVTFGVDGTSGHGCNGSGGSGGTTIDYLGGPVSVVQRSGQPHIFYADIINGNLRAAYWN